MAGALLVGWQVCGWADAPETNGLLDLPFDDLLDMEIRSAGKRWEQIRDIPASVTVLTREDIARYGWVTREELLANVPGFFILDNLEDRFVGTRGTVGGGVQFLVNGVPQHPSRQKTLTMTDVARLNIPVESIDRVEVIRGPMSVIYGNNAFLGVVNVVTDAIGENGPRVSAGLGSRHSGSLFARAGAASPEGFVSLNAGAYRTDGLAGDYAHMLSPERVAELDPRMRRDMDGDMDLQDLSVDLSTGWRGLTVDARYTQADQGLYAFSPPFEDGTRLRLDTLHAAVGYERELRKGFGIRASAIYSNERYDAYQLDFFSPQVYGDQQQEADRLDLELDLIYEPGPALSLIAGYRFRRLDGIRNRISLSPLLAVTDRLDRVQTNDLFAELSWQPLDRLRFVAGARLSQLPNAYRRARIDGRTGARTLKEVQVDDRLTQTGRIAALWSPDDRQVVKLIWGTAAQDNDNFDFPEPERIETLELDYLRSERQWSLSASLFRNRTRAIARTIQTIDPQTGRYTNVNDNSGQWVTNGAELILEAQPLPSVGLALSATWQETEDLDSRLEPGYSPALLAKLKADYRRGPRTYALYARYVGGMEADWDFVAGTTAGVTERIGERSDGYWDLGANLRWERPGSGPYANLHCSNLLDTEIRYPANELADFSRGLIGPGRVFTLTIGWRF